MGSVSGEDSIVEFWMNKIKTHCYATYKTVDQAIATRQVCAIGVIQDNIYIYTMYVWHKYCDSFISLSKKNT